ncbi:hypothetical protein [Anabaena subtropica]|uniref:Uncharacterized protein n=1 Tax=Anabaena subtropica FACHB-260 TaxID=2692884 RepID=A0ABR8CH89_9NOST|nr:hypothetical protein [Anabaena subtropica]MBD2342580.1 hypothetical protein [Anabaena subtropica FACHB-260]
MDISSQFLVVVQLLQMLKTEPLVIPLPKIGDCIHSFISTVAIKLYKVISDRICTTILGHLSMVKKCKDKVGGFSRKLRLSQQTTTL